LISDILEDLHSVGLVMITEDREHFSVTHMMKNVITQKLKLEKNFQSHIIVEKDFMLYAYVNDNEFLEGILELFTKIKFKFNGYLVCSIKADKIFEVMSKSIKTPQILRYLNGNAHPKVISRRKQEFQYEDQETIDTEFLYIPENVAKQLLTWQVTFNDEERARKRKNG
jgi:hypothetical protein